MDKDELIDIWREVVLKNTTNGSCNFQQAAIDFAELVAEPWIETNKALAKEIIELKKQAEQEPVGYWDGKFSKGGASALYEVPQASAFGYHYENYPLYAAPVRTKDLTDDEIISALGADMDTDEDKAGFLEIARIVIAADREKNK